MIIGKKSAALAVAATGALLATAATPAGGTPHMKSTPIATPLLTVHMSGKNSALDVAGPHRFSAGRVNFELVAGKGEQAFAVLRLHNGYTLRELGRDFAAVGAGDENPTPKSLKALNRIVRRVTFCGGADSGKGHTTVSGSVVLPKADTYYLMNDTAGPGTPVTPVKLHVTERAGNRAAPASSATVKATSAKRWRGSKQLPASGTITFENRADHSPHFMVLQHVKDGTTRKQVVKALQSNGGGPSLPGVVAADVLSAGHSMTLTYTLPKGDYAVMCFFPDLKTGMPHAFMGMVRVVHLS